MAGSTGKPDMKALIAKADKLSSRAKAETKRLDDIGIKLEGTKRKLGDLKQSREGRR
jgi:hypothetical protein